MKNVLKSLLVSSLFWGFFLWSPIAKAQNYSTYCNARFQFCVEYPQYFGIKPAPANGDGREFYNQNSFQIIASGSNHLLGDTLQEHLQHQKKTFDTVTYQKIEDNWFVLSGYQGKYIIYIKTYINPPGAASNTLYMKYPAEKKQEYDDIVTRISNSFSPRIQNK